MKTDNKLLFENLDTEYAKDFDTIKKFGFRKLEIYQDVIGFDENTYGCVAVHRHHAASGLFDELPTCRILKKKGYFVLLIAESVYVISPDALINDV